MNTRKQFLAIVLSSLLWAACHKDVSSFYDDVLPGKGHGKNEPAGQVYTLSNEAGGNKVMAYSRSAKGELTFMASYATGGKGTGGGLGNQGSVVLSEDNQWLLAVNAGSNSLSAFKVTGKELQLTSTVSSGGILPVSVTIYKDLVYVLNAGGNGNIRGFRLGANGNLQAITGSSRPLSSSAAGAAQISFVAGGGVVVITEKATNNLISYTINKQGVPGTLHMLPAANPTPFGFAAGRNGIIYVSEAAGGAAGASTVSAYHVANDGVITLVKGPVAAGETAACWVVVTQNEKYVYATNTGSNTVSSFAAGHGTNLSVLEAVAASTGTGSLPIDAALSNNSKFLYVLNAGTKSIAAFAVGNNGSLAPVQTVLGLPAGANGLAAK